MHISLSLKRYHEWFSLLSGPILTSQNFFFQKIKTKCETWLVQKIENKIFGPIKFQIWFWFLEFRFFLGSLRQALAAGQQNQRQTKAEYVNYSPVGDSCLAALQVSACASATWSGSRPRSMPPRFSSTRCLTPLSQGCRIVPAPCFSESHHVLRECKKQRKPISV